jgi:CRISPR/Cas system CSM-associated protein Csm3 (group 7 of RAMP superfamily)
MQRLQMSLRLESDATFGRGEGVAGLVDEEVEYETATGLPFVRGRTLKGLLVEECANLLFALQAAGLSAPVLSALEDSAGRLFGRPGSDVESAALLHIGPALLSEQLREAVRDGVERRQLRPAAVLESLTAIRRQTAIDEGSAAPEKGSLRSMRVVLRQTSFRAWLDFASDPGADDLALLAACTLSVRRGGIGRNRGRGRLCLRLLDEQGQDITGQYFEHFKQLLAGGQG